MRWVKPVIGDFRVKTKFLIIPRQMQDAGRVNVVTKWLENESGSFNQTMCCLACKLTHSLALLEWWKWYTQEV